MVPPHVVIPADRSDSIISVVSQAHRLVRCLADDGLLRCEWSVDLIERRGHLEQVPPSIRAQGRSVTVPQYIPVALQVQIRYNALGLQAHLRGLAADARHAPLLDLHLTRGLECRVEKRI